MVSSWLIIGISGISCSGKSTLANSLFSHFSSEQDKETYSKVEQIDIGEVKIIRQDDYFYSIDSPFHTWVQVNDRRHINREHLSALNMEKMCEDLYVLLGDNYVPYEKQSSVNQSTTTTTTTPIRNVNILIVEGYLIFNHSTVNSLCQLRLCLQITFEKCLARRSTRVYPQPTPPGYFEQYVWPIYSKHYDQYPSLDNLLLLNGDDSKEKCFADALQFISQNT